VTLECGSTPLLRDAAGRIRPRGERPPLRKARGSPCFSKVQRKNVLCHTAHRVWAATEGTDENTEDTEITERQRFFPTAVALADCVMKTQTIPSHLRAAFSSRPCVTVQQIPRASRRFPQCRLAGKNARQHKPEFPMFVRMMRFFTANCPWFGIGRGRAAL